MKSILTLLLILLTTWTATSQIGKKLNAAAGDNLAGTWQHQVNGQVITLLLYNNGQGEFEGNAINYTQNNGKLTLRNGKEAITYTYKLSGNSLTLSGGDLQQPATFTRSINNNGNQVQNNTTPVQKSTAGRDLLGTWTSQGVSFTFKADGELLYNDKTMEYTVSGNTVYCSNEEAGVSVTYQYEVKQNRLLLRYNGNTITLEKKNGTQPARTNNPPATGGKPAFLGNWTSNENNQLTMMEGGRMTLDGYDLTYTYDASTITVISPEGRMVFNYTINGNKMTVSSNGATWYYTRNGAAQSGNSGTQVAGGKIDPTMVGRWSRMSTTGGGYNSNAGTSSSEYFVLNANGTYEYYSEASASGYGGGMYGGSNSQSGDRGTWRVQGNVIIATSQTQGVIRYPFEKRNNRNGEPCIVIDGTEYVSYYKKAPWR
jgi:hypothetical protein